MGDNIPRVPEQEVNPNHEWVVQSNHVPAGTFAVVYQRVFRGSIYSILSWDGNLVVGPNAAWMEEPLAAAAAVVESTLRPRTCWSWSEESAAHCSDRVDESCRTVFRPLLVDVIPIPVPESGCERWNGDGSSSSWDMQCYE